MQLLKVDVILINPVIINLQPGYKKGAALFNP